MVSLDYMLRSEVYGYGLVGIYNESGFNASRSIQNGGICVPKFRNKFSDIKIIVCDYKFTDGPIDNCPALV